jgi:hypothetical protein
VLITALKRTSNPTAIDRLTDELPITPIAAENAPANLAEAAIAVAAEHGMNDFVRTAQRP